MATTNPIPSRALVIDDNEVNRELAIELLAEHGLAADAASDGPMGLGLLHRNKYDIVLLDLSMPGMDGHAVCKSVREDLSIRNTYLVAYTANAFPEQRNELLEAGFNALLIKPVSAESLGQAIDTLWA